LIEFVRHGTVESAGVFEIR